MVEQGNGYKKRVARAVGTILRTASEIKLVGPFPPGPFPEEVQIRTLQQLDGEAVIPVEDSPEGPGSQEKPPVFRRGK